MPGVGRGFGPDSAVLHPECGPQALHQAAHRVIFGQQAAAEALDPCGPGGGGERTEQNLRNPAPLMVIADRQRYLSAARILRVADIAAQGDGQAARTVVGTLHRVEDQPGYVVAIVGADQIVDLAG